MSKPMKQRVFREPDGRRTGFLWVALGLFLLGFFLYHAVVLDNMPLVPALVGALFVLMGVPELLPRERHYLAGLLRLAAVVFAFCLVGTLLLRPSVI